MFEDIHHVMTVLQKFTTYFAILYSLLETLLKVAYKKKITLRFRAWNKILRSYFKNINRIIFLKSHLILRGDMLFVRNVHFIFFISEQKDCGRCSVTHKLMIYQCIRRVTYQYILVRYTTVLSFTLYTLNSDSLHENVCERRAFISRQYFSVSLCSFLS